ncbi:hypothetical protein [Flavobacterium suzhouense]|uniref:Beta-lactamase-inhibitor-like PepSY-like domain-containing protein n=1 Tax=Flavobacterium suzhouense TaxID=1529638 RepID=A0ABW5NZB7_9FLAO
MRKLLFMLTITACVAIISPVKAYINVSGIIIVQEKQYKKINVSDIPKEVLDKIKKQYGNYTINEAQKADDGEYKLILSKDGIDNTATFTSAGDLIKIY